MKKIIFILGLAAVVLGTSCSDVLDLNPADRFSPATVWSTTTTADKYVIGLYSIFGANTEMRGGDAYASPRLSDLQLIVYRPQSTFLFYFIFTIKSIRIDDYASYTLISAFTPRISLFASRIG